MEDTGSKAPQPERRFDNRINLSPLEHLLIGSSAEFKGKFFNSDSFMNLMKDGSHMDPEMLRPIGITENPNSVEEVQKARADKGYLSGAINVFEINDFLDLSDEGFDTCIELSKVGEDGLVIPSWRISLFDRNENAINPNREKLDRLSLEGKLSEFFDLGYKEGTDELYLSVKPGFKPKNDI